MKKLGDYGEELATEYLLNKGYEIVARNYHSVYGEIDIIVRYDSYIVFCEVKLRKNNSHGNPGAFVDFRKQMKIKKTALQFISENEICNQDLRFDVLEITCKPFLINHIENAFE